MKRKRELVLFGAIAIITIAITGWYVYRLQNSVAPEETDQSAGRQEAESSTPEFDLTVVADGLSNVWDIGFLPDGTALITERSGAISRLQDGNKVILLSVTEVLARGEGGLMGLAIDPDYSENQFIYACFNTDSDIRVARFKVNPDLSGTSERQDIITGLPANTTTFPGRHSGCRPRFGPDNYLWVGTGDVAIGTNPQDPKSLGGKILRVDRDGQPAPDNLPPPFDPRIFSYGHRNTQGLAFFTAPRADGVSGYSIEHGSSRDDEVNELRPGNFGWDPVPGYNEQVPMTDAEKFPEALPAAWSSGSPTIAPSGGAILEGDKWQSWQGALVIAVLKGQHVRILTFDDSGQLAGEQAVLKTFGRIRSAVLGPGNDLYLTTDNGDGQDKIIRVIPK